MSIKNAYHASFPTAEELWQRGGAAVDDSGVPHFDLELGGSPTEYFVKPLYVRDKFRKRRIGETVMLGYTLSDGIDRLAALRVLNDTHRNDAEFITTASTAWTTTVNGYNGRRDDRIARELGIQTVSIGAEGSTNRRFLSAESVASISLAKAAQSEQLILADVAERFGLPSLQYGIGDSRGAMIKPGHSLYAEQYANEIMFTDIKAPCVPDKLGPEDLPKVGLWLAVEAIGAAAVTSSLLKERDLSLLTNTFECNPRSLPASIGGIMPALMSGEAGKLAQLAPNDMPGHVVLYGHDILSSAHRWHEVYANKSGVTLKDVPKGSHSHLLRRVDLQLDRIERARDEVLSVPSTTQIDWNYVKTGNKKQADLRLVV